MKGLFWIFATLIKTIIHIIKGIFWFLKNAPSYVITLSFLSVGLVTRTRIGEKVFAPWTVRLFKDDEYPYERVWLVRLFTVALLYVWVRIFFLLHVFSSFPMDSFKDMEVYKKIAYLSYSYDFLGQGIFNLPYEYSLPYLFSYFIVFLGISHILSFEIYRASGDEIPTKNLGDSLLFGWVKNFWTISSSIIWCWIEPTLMAVIGFALFTKGYPIYAFFFWIAGTSMVILGQDVRLKSVRKQGKVVDSKIDAKKIITKHKQTIPKRGVKTGRGGARIIKR